jgi:hypothetical protein
MAVCAEKKGEVEGGGRGRGRGREAGGDERKIQNFVHKNDCNVHRQELELMKYTIKFFVFFHTYLLVGKSKWQTLDNNTVMNEKNEMFNFRKHYEHGNSCYITGIHS